MAYFLNCKNPEKIKIYHKKYLAYGLKMIKNVSFYIFASEASYIYFPHFFCFYVLKDSEVI